MATHKWSMLDQLEETRVHGDTVVVHARPMELKHKWFMATLRWSMLDQCN